MLLTLVGAFTLDSFVFHVVYLVAGAYLIGNWWINRSISALSFTRNYVSHAFPGEIILVQLQVNNPTRLPIPWIYFQESLPLEISNVKFIRQIISLPPKCKFNLDYQLNPRKRGYYPLGPIQFSSGDLLGLMPEVQKSGQSSYLTVFPKIIHFKNIKIPSRSPLGTLRYRQPIFEDPARTTGKREYIPGDSLRRIDWKSTAISGHLQVKLFEPSIALETVLFLDLNMEDYHFKTRYDASELAIVVAASLAHWIAGQKQTVGLISNGLDSLVKNISRPVPARKGRANLIHILELLARIELNQGFPIAQIIRQNRPRLTWGTTIIIITGHCDQELLDELYQSKRSGINVFLVMVGTIPGTQEIKQKVDILNIPFCIFQDELDLNIWRR